MAQEVSTQNEAAKPPSLRLVQMLDGRKDQFRALMKSDDEAEAFLRIVKNAVIRDPKIAEADQQTVFLECQKAAADGLVLDGREAVLNRYNKRVKIDNKWVSTVVVAYIPMILGIKKRVRNSGVISAWNFGMVYANEVKAKRFRFWRDDVGQHLLHEPFMPAIDGPKGEPVAVYSAVRLKDGTTDYELMDIDQVNSIKERTSSRKFSDDKTKPGEIVGPWATDYEEMCKKTVARRHSKSLPVSAEDRAVIERVDNQYDFTKNADEVYEAPATVPASVHKRRASSAADKLQPVKAEDTPHDEHGVVDEEDDANDADHMVADDDGGEQAGRPDPRDAF